MAGIGKAKKRTTKRRTKRRGIGAAGKTGYMDLLLRAGGAAAAAVAVNPIMTQVLKVLKKTEADVPHIKQLIKIVLGYVAMSQAPQREVQLMGEGAIVLGIIEFLQNSMPDLFAPKAIRGIGSSENYIQLTNEDIHGVEDYLGSVESGTEELVFG